MPRIFLVVNEGENSWKFGFDSWKFVSIGFTILNKMLNHRDRLLLEELQSNFPLSSRPYREIAKKVGLSEDEVIDKLRAFKKRGIIRYIGAIFNQGKLGLKSTLIAMSVHQQKIKRIARIINEYPQVSHNYLRDDKFNLWFTLSMPSESKLLSLIEEIKKRTGIKDILNLATLKVFKIDARFNINRYEN